MLTRNKQNKQNDRNDKNSSNNNNIQMVMNDKIMNLRMISGTIDGVIYVNMANVKIVRSSDEQGHYCIYLDSDVIPFSEKKKRDEAIRELTGDI